jgi:hypothetical protein
MRTLLGSGLLGSGRAHTAARRSAHGRLFMNREVGQHGACDVGMGSAETYRQINNISCDTVFRVSVSAFSIENDRFRELGHDRYSRDKDTNVESEEEYGNEVYSDEVYCDSKSLNEEGCGDNGVCIDGFERNTASCTKCVYL